MKKLADYNLQQGDWVKFVRDGWLEFSHYNDFSQPIFYNNSCLYYHDIEAVIRPSFIIRDELDHILSDCRKPYYNGLTQKDGICHGFEEVKPKEEKKSLFDNLKEIDPILNDKNGCAIKFLCNEIEKLQNKIEALEKEKK